MKPTDITNEVYHRLTVIKQFDKTRWTCLCECGNIINADKGNLRSGHTKSCGCFQKEKMKTQFRTHGLRSHPLYKIWHWMKERCDSPYATSYPRYGGKGIKVCSEWYDFTVFYSDMIDGYAKGLQLDRKDSKGNYEKSNCRWVTPKVNARNTSRVKLNEEIVITIRASNKTTNELMKDYNVCRTTINNIRNNVSWN